MSGRDDYEVRTIFRSRRANRRRNGAPAAPRLVETFEHRTLLTAPNVLTPTGTVTTATPEITWDARR